MKAMEAWRWTVAGVVLILMTVVAAPVPATASSNFLSGNEEAPLIEPGPPVGLTVLTFAGTSVPIYWAKDHVYAGPGGKEIAIITPVPSDTTAPSTPTSLSSSTLTAASVHLSWTGVTTGTDSTLAGYKIYRQKGSGANLPVGTVSASSSSTAYQFDEIHLQPSTAYTYTVVAFDKSQNHSSASGTATFTTSASSTDSTVPSIPLNASGAFTGYWSTKIQWRGGADAGGSGVAGYRVYRRVGSSGSFSLISGSSLLTTLSYDDSGLTNNTTYNYVVRTVDGANNESGNSDIVALTAPLQSVLIDNFNRSDAEDLGSNWLDSGTFQIQSNTAWAGSGTYAYTNATPSNMRAQVQILYNDGNPIYGGLAFWDNSPGRYYAQFMGSTLSLYWNGTSLGNVSIGTTTATSTITVDADSTSRRIKVWWNGGLKIDYTDPNTDRSTSGHAMLYGGVGGQKLDNFELYTWTGTVP